MKATSKEASHSRPSEQRMAASEPQSQTMRVSERGALGAAMVDALEDILEWERASERALKVAGKASS